MAKQVMRIEGKTDYARGITCNAGRIQDGSGVNVVPAECRIEVDLRVPSPQPVEGGMNRPPYTKDAGIAALFEHAKGLAAEIGFELEDVKLTGGGSDGNFTAAIAPTLDGLGVDGLGGHTHHEQLFVSSLVPRARLLLGLFETLQPETPAPA